MTKPNDTPRSFHLPVSGGEIFRIGFDSGLVLYINAPTAVYELAFAGPFTLEQEPNQRTVLRPSTMLAEDLKTFVDLVGVHVNAGVASESGRLELDLDNESRIVIDPAEEFDAWELRGSDELVVVCTSGGELLVWGSLNEQADTSTAS